MPDTRKPMPFMDPARKGAKVEMDNSLPRALMGAVRAYGAAAPIAQDGTGEALSYAALLSRIFVLRRLLKKEGALAAPRVGLMMPTSTTMLTAIFGVLFADRVATILNFTSGATAVLNACKIAELKTVLTSRVFVERVGLGPMIEAIEGAGVRVLYAEELAAKANRTDKIAAKLSFLFQKIAHRAAAKKANDPAVILFTSGSEGAPKGVVLSHKNILSNIAQFTAHIDVGAWDKMFACLPMYHSFGLTVGSFLPLLSGMRTVFYPSPLHYHEVPKMIRETKATILLTTDTFLTGYARMGEAADFASLRYIVAGAEKLKDQTRAIWEGLFGKVVFEGYGVTETAPVISVNTPEFYSQGSVGKVLPWIETALHPVEGIDCGAELWVRGPNVMLGYMKADAPGVIKPPKDGWHNTGDVVSLDEGGYLTIKGRIKRFAKIGGEMISLVAVEQVVSQICPGVLHAVVSVPHSRRGEAVVLLTEHEKIDPDAIRAEMRAQGLSDLSMPREILSVEKVPVLGSGKIDYITARIKALETLGFVDAPLAQNMGEETTAKTA